MQCPKERASHTLPLMTLLRAQGDRVRTAGDQNPKIVLALFRSLMEPALTGNQTDHFVSTGFPYHRLLQSAGATEALGVPSTSQELNPSCLFLIG